MAEPQPSTQVNSYCTDDNINAMISQVMNESTLVSTMNDTAAEAVQDGLTADGFQSADTLANNDTTPSASWFKRFRKSAQRGLKSLCCIRTPTDEL